MSKILKTHPKTVQSHKDLVMQCLDDKDESIRLRALDLLYGMVSVHRKSKSSIFWKKCLVPRLISGFQKNTNGNSEKIDGAYG